MPKTLSQVYEGWDGFHRSIVSAVEPLNQDQLSYRSHPDMRSIGEIALHIADGRVDWFRRLEAPHSAELWQEIESRKQSPTTAEELISWLNKTWMMVDAVLNQWTVDDLDASFSHPYQGKVYAVSRQWTIWRIMAHDIYHGGQLSELLGAEGIFPLELTLLGGHLTEPPVIGEA